MNNALLAEGALKALTTKGFETYKGYCSRFGRQVCEFVYGDARYDKFWRPDKDPSAKEAALAFQKAGFGVPKNQLQYGDILFKTTGEFGHIGIYTDSGVAENSTYHWNRHPGDARGLRSLSQFGEFQIAIRLPSPVQNVVVPEVAPLVINWNGQMFTMRELIERGGHTVQTITEKLPESRVYIKSTPKVK